jgi:hypothetical protein
MAKKSRVVKVTAKSRVAASSSAELPEPTDFDNLLESLLVPKPGTPGGKVIDLAPHLHRHFVLGIVGGRKPPKK